MNGNPQIRLKSRLILVMFGLSLLMQLLDPYKSWVIVSVSLGLTCLVAYLWVRTLSRNLVLVREMRYGWAQVGDYLEERLTLHNHGWAPALWVEVRDQSNLPGYSVSRVTGVEGYSRNTWQNRGQCTRRGLFTLGPTNLLASDLFGIFSLHMTNPSSTTVMVMPPIVPLPAIEVAPGGRSGEGRPRSNAPERTVSATGVRQYVAGEPLRWIHWPTTARHNQPYVRILDGIPSGDWWIFLDMDRSVQLGEGWNTTDEHGVILAASLADRGLQMRRAVGLVVNGQELVWMPPQENSSRRWELLRALALAEPGPHTLAELLGRTRFSIGRRSSLVIITPSVQADWIQALIPLLWRETVPTVLLLDPPSFGKPELKSETQNAMSLLADLGVKRYLITRDLLDRPEARPGQAGRQEWRFTPTGRAVLVNQPGNAAWRTLP